MTDKRAPKIVEVVFDIAYLLSALIIGIVLLSLSKGNSVKLIWGIMALVLVSGDSFHLVPRILRHIKGDSILLSKACGYGKLITSITMTVFYILLLYAGMEAYSLKLSFWTGSIYRLSVVRIVLCLLPQNQWASEKPSVKWAIIRNIPFFVLGMIVMVFYIINNTYSPLRFAWIGIMLSFAFYLPVTLLSNKYKKIGMLMLPKSAAYIWILCMGLLI